MGENAGENRPQKINRHRIAGQRARHQRVIEPGAAPQRGNHAHGNAQNAGNQNGAKSQLHGGHEMLEKILQHRRARAERFAEIALQNIGEVMPVLHRQRQIQPQPLQSLGVHGRINGFFAHHDFHRIARHQPDQGESGERETQINRYQNQNAAQHIKQHDKHSWFGQRSMLGCKRDACKTTPLRQMPERHSDGLYSTFTPSKRTEPKGLIL